jgi:hypothetical protein
MSAKRSRKAQRRSGSCSFGATGRTGPDILSDRLLPALIVALVALPLVAGLSWLQKVKQLDKAVIGVSEHARAIDALVLEAATMGRPRGLDALRSEQVQLTEELARAERWLAEVRAVPPNERSRPD